MSVRFKIDASADPAAFEWLPCSINTTGPCKKDQYFLVEEDDSTTPSTPVVHLRGRKLQGDHHFIGSEGLGDCMLLIEKVTHSHCRSALQDYKQNSPKDTHLCTFSEVKQACKAKTSRLSGRLSVTHIVAGFGNMTSHLAKAQAGCVLWNG